MVEIIWTEPALNNLDDIAEYIALNNPIAARHFVANVLNKVERLATFPESGRTPPELESFAYREIVVNPCRVFYRFQDDKVFILHVMRQERELRMFLMQPDF